jgi:hypothetical protein
LEQKSRNKNSNIREQKLQKSEKKNYKNLGTKQKSRKQNYKNLGTKIQEQKLQKSGTKITEI